MVHFLSFIHGWRNWWGRGIKCVSMERIYFLGSSACIVWRNFEGEATRLKEHLVRKDENIFRCNKCPLNMEHAQLFLTWIQSERMPNSADNSVNSTKFYCSKIFLFLSHCISTDFSDFQFFLNFSKYDEIDGFTIFNAEFCNTSHPRLPSPTWGLTAYHHQWRWVAEKNRA
jgi:hypothetical protein